MFSKTGAEGMHVLALPEQGLGIAVKCADGATRAAEVAAAALFFASDDSSFTTGAELFVDGGMVDV